MKLLRLLLHVSPLGCVFIVVLAQSTVRPPKKVQPPKIWDDAALADWVTPVAGLNVRPSHYSSTEYYSVPPDNLRTYPVYHPDSEPPGYWEELKKKKPEPLVDVAKIKTKKDWIAAGGRAFRELDNVLRRTNDPALVALARDSEAFKGVRKSPDGSMNGLRWVVTEQGVMLSFSECTDCHSQARPDKKLSLARPSGPPPEQTTARLRQFPTGLRNKFVNIELSRRYLNEPFQTFIWRMFTVPWAPDERVEGIRTMKREDLARLLAVGLPPGTGGLVIPRINGSPFYVTRVPDLRTLRFSRYMDATGTHRLRGPEDVARYAALITGADQMDFGPHRILTDEQRKVRFRYADEVLYAIGMYLMSLEPPKNPNPAPREMITSGEGIFRREDCAACHVPPAYTSGKLTLAQGWAPPTNHPNRKDIFNVSVGTDSGTALKTRKGTGLYKIPSLRGVWYRPLFLHDGSLTSLEELFDPARLNVDYEPKGWNPPGVTKRAVPGHTYGLSLNPDEKSALLAFLRSL